MLNLCSATTALWLASIVAVSAPALRDASRDLPKAPVLERIVVIGASASAGFSMSGEAVGPLYKFLEPMIASQHEPVRGMASELFFLDPEATGEQQVTNALRANPTLVIAADFLFWYGYGEAKDDGERTSRMELGLAQLARFTCPIVISELPDMSASIGLMLRKEQVPSPETLAKINSQIRVWAEKRPTIAKPDLPGLMNQIHNNKELTVRGNTWKAGSEEKLLQPDKLHPTREGNAALAIWTLDAFAKTQKDLSKDAIRWSVDAVLAATAKKKKSPAGDAAASKPAGAKGE